MFVRVFSCVTRKMYNTQTNGARFIYTLSECVTENADATRELAELRTQKSGCNSDENENTTVNVHTPALRPKTKKLEREWCRLKNGYCLTKEARSDEKVRYTETDMHSIVRTVLFIHVFRLGPNETLLELVNTGEVTYPSVDVQPLELDLNTACELLDGLFGVNFSRVVRRVVLSVYHEYQYSWMYYPFYSKLSTPSARDIIKLCRFMNASTSHYSNPTTFVVNNCFDHKDDLQNQLKYLN